ncbi:MAG: hypothetical protein ABH877_01490 [bacterium]
MSEFHRRRFTVRSGVRAACKDCTRAETLQARAEQPPRVDKHKHLVRERTHAAIRRGELLPGPCAICGALPAEAHHLSYDTPSAHLEVVWLCEAHHSLEHGIRPWTRQLELFPQLS